MWRSRVSVPEEEEEEAVGPVAQGSQLRPAWLAVPLRPPLRRKRLRPSPGRLGQLGGRVAWQTVEVTQRTPDPLFNLSLSTATSQVPGSAAVGTSFRGDAPSRNSPKPKWCANLASCTDHLLTRTWPARVPLRQRESISHSNININSNINSSSSSRPPWCIRTQVKPNTIKCHFKARPHTRRLGHRLLPPPRAPCQEQRATL